MYIVYKTTNHITNQIYIGVHRQLISDPYEFDGYFGSGDWTNDITKQECKKYFPNKMSLKEALEKFGEKNFSRATLYHSKNINEVYNKEAELVTSEFIVNESNYNLIPGGKIPPNHKGYIWVNDTISEYRVPKDSIVTEKFVKGRLPCKESTRLKLRESSLRNGNIPPRHDKASGYWTESRIEKTRISSSNLHKNRIHPSRTTEWKLTQSNRMNGINNPQYGSRFKWITNGVDQIRWDESKIPEGFYFGTLNKNSSYKKQDIIKCPHCDLTATVGSMKRWHFDNCKYK